MIVPPPRYPQLQPHQLSGYSFYNNNMPHVEVLPNSASAAAPGWHYVVDTGYDPSKVAFNPKDRKRVAARPGGPRGENELSARQQTAIARRIAELDRDNDMKQVVNVPGKQGITSMLLSIFVKADHSTAPAKTQNTRRILQYQRQIKHWLDEEEALLQQAPPPRPTAAGARTGQLTRRQSTMPQTPAEGTPGPAQSASTPFGTGREFEDDVDPLLSIESSVPPPIKPAELEALLSAPPLSYAESHAAPPAPGGPRQRHFCDNCGYWGKIKCLKCGARVCGLECKDAHEATRCLKWA
jgi:zinc finger HIT domain-containing protein 1